MGRAVLVALVLSFSWCLALGFTLLLNPTFLLTIWDRWWDDPNGNEPTAKEVFRARLVGIASLVSAALLIVIIHESIIAELTPGRKSTILVPFG